MDDKRDLMKPILFKFGFALAISFAGFLCSQFRLRNKRPPLLPPSSSSSDDQSSKVDLGRGRGPRLDNQGLKAATAASSNVVHFAVDAYEKKCIPKVNFDDSNIGLRPSNKHGVDKDGLLPEFQELVKEFDFSAANAGLPPKKNVEAPRSGLETPKAYKTVEDDEYEQEIRHLKSKVKTLRERERNLEVQLLEYYGLKEQETAVMELQNRLKINNMEAKLFTLKIESLQADNRRLESQVCDHAKSVSDLEAAKAKIKFLKKKIRYEAEQNRGQILNLQQRVVKLQDQEHKTNESNKDAQIRLQKIEELEKEIEDLRKSNLKLQIENSDLSRRLDATQFLANSLLEDQEKESLKEEMERLSRENEALTKEIEQLQAHRCADIEELVYLRWINACLRYELRNFQPPAGKTAARDLSKTLSPKSEEKAKKLILDYANTEGIEGKSINITDFDSDQWSSSQASSHTDPGDPDDSAVDFPSTAKTSSNKVKFISKLRKLLRGKGSQQNLTLLAEKSAASVEDSGSPRYSSSNSPGTNATRAEGQGIGYTTPSRNSSRHSMDFHRLNSQKEDDGKTEDSIRRRNSDVGYVNKKFVLGSDESSNSSYRSQSQDTESTEKSELMKYAEVLKDTRGAKNQSQRKAASIGSF
ncbi:protein CHUP1, chloroplastic [Benincasa hispida]|uniref:protein CHUP1, chloroplastic n=1 Tax=Benincasa hispida TaxID=102211 RepID=UPI001901A02F|nr:protein CHUP1, chloroplastic [Benincasa hispida]XP_038898689.1 protein CHUP1, chloroplastic [Benincasa hispida]XP_038898690.1 protein CHUP1, chloroplastic [Benincasa hispida]